MKTRFRTISHGCDHSNSEGFTLIEVMIAIVILMVGLMALMGLFAKALGAVQSSQESQIAKQKVREALESVYTARNDESISYNQIQNEADGGIFKGGFQTMYLPGADGIPGTNQDTAILDRVILPGKDGIVQTAPNASAAAGDDVLVPLSNFQRQILIAPVTDANGTVNPFMRRVTVTIRVNPGSRFQHDYETSGYISGSQ
jgi:prepilin-type N-terminal cleavage/methylation domain-containing protein